MTPADLPVSLQELWPLLILAYPHILNRGKASPQDLADARKALAEEASAAAAAAHEADKEKLSRLDAKVSGLADSVGSLSGLETRVATTEAAVDHIDVDSLHERISGVKDSVQQVEAHLAASVGRIEGRLEASNELLSRIHEALLAKVE